MFRVNRFCRFLTNLHDLTSLCVQGRDSGKFRPMSEVDGPKAPRKKGHKGSKGVGGSKHHHHLAKPCWGEDANCEHVNPISVIYSWSLILDQINCALWLYRIGFVLRSLGTFPKKIVGFVHFGLHINKNITPYRGEDLSEKENYLGFIYGWAFGKRNGLNGNVGDTTE